MQHELLLLHKGVSNQSNPVTRLDKTMDHLRSKCHEEETGSTHSSSEAGCGRLNWTTHHGEAQLGHGPIWGAAPRLPNTFNGGTCATHSHPAHANEHRYSTTNARNAPNVRNVRKRSRTSETLETFEAFETFESFEGFGTFETFATFEAFESRQVRNPCGRIGRREPPWTSNNHP